MGFLNHSVREFSFIGPDRLPVDVTDIDQCVNIANIIASMGLPNYAQARIPLKSGLNIQKWEKELVNYPDKMFIEYLKFGFPLLLSAPERLHDVNINNHHSALQYPMAVDNYLQKGIVLGAIVGPVTKVCSEAFHCSPLLRLSKDNEKRRIVLNLSHPHGTSVNDSVPRDKFDGEYFTLRFPSIDTIVS